MNNLLIVDDNFNNLQLLANILVDNHYNVEYAENGAEAVEIVREEDFDLILMDIMMPEMNGYEACAAIKQLPKKMDIPIIFLTAKNDEESISRAFELGGVDYVCKPFNKGELLARVKTHLALKESRDSLQELNGQLEQKVAERTRELHKANAELQELDNAKNDFLKIINHEIRTPLNGIIGLSRILEGSLANSDEAVYIQALSESSERLDGFARQALLISELRVRPKELLNPELKSIRPVLAAVLEQSLADLEAKGIQVRMDCPVDLELYMDQGLLKQCLGILVENAAKHAPEGGQLTLSAASIEDKLLLKIKDNGAGFPEALLAEGIKPFANTAHIDQNPGLDLYLCRLITEAHGGTLELENEQGGRVKMELPML